MSNPLIDFTFRDTGKSVKIRKVSPMLAVDVEATIPKPKPPVNKVDYGNGPVDEPNYADPGYDQAVKARSNLVGAAVLRATILRGVVVEGEEWRQEVAEYRQFVKDMTGEELTEPSDLVVYVMRICVGTTDDMNELMAAISTRSQPTAEAVERSKASFPGALPGA